MQVLEIKNNLVKVVYDVNDNLVLSGFLVIEDENMPYVGQVVSLKADFDANYAMVKLLFTFDENGVLNNYDGSIPSLKSALSVLPSRELLGILPAETPILIGKLAQQECVLSLDKSIFENNLVICSNKPENTALLVQNFLAQFEQTGQKAVVFDTDGSLVSGPKLVFGRDFRMPLSYEAINYIYENDLNDIDVTSRALIQNVFLELQDYIKTIPEKFIPFETFLNVIDAQYKETGIIELVLLKNKLLRYRDANVFARDMKDILKLSMNVEQNNVTVIDISYADTKLQQEIIQYSYELLERIDANVYSFINVNNDNSSKKLLKRFADKINVSTTIICGHEYKYLSELKQAAGNLILFAPLVQQHDFADYNAFLNKLNYDEFVVYGSHTQNLPLILQLDDLDAIEDEARRIEQEAAEAEETADVQTEVVEEKLEIELEEPVALNLDDADLEEFASVEEESSELPEFSGLAEPETEVETEIPAKIEEEIEAPIEEEWDTSEIETPELEFDPNAITPELNFDMDETPFTPVQMPEEKIENEFIEAANFTVESTPEVFETELETEFEPTLDTELEPAIEPELAEDIFAEEFVQPLETEATIVEDEEFATDEEDIDLAAALDEEPAFDFDSAPEIDFGVETVEETIVEEPAPAPVQEPGLPIYPANDIDRKDVVLLEQGDTVIHPKYGKGVVEKMIKYGNKTLCSINFEGVGRRLLDPAISDISKA